MRARWRRGEQVIFLLVLLLCIFSIGAVCTEEKAQEYLATGTNYTFVKQQAADYVLVLDKSGSMRGGKIDQEKLAAQALVTQLTHGDKAAIIAFDSRPTLYSSLTNQTTTLSAAINKIEPGDFTQYGPALMRARELFNGNRRVVVLLSDGKPDDNKTTLMNTVQGLVEDNVCIFTIAYADSADEQAQELLAEIAEISVNRTSCGGYFRAGENIFELKNAFNEIYTRISSDALLNVTAHVGVDEEVRFAVQVKSSLNDKEVSQSACFNLAYTYVVARNKEIVYENTTNNPLQEMHLPAGSYEYIVTAAETCGGTCRITGKTQGTFSVESDTASCETPWEELSVLLANNKYVEVQILPDGFSPQTVGTDGIVIWKNLDTRPRKVRAPDNSFVSPFIQPGESWSKIFPPGAYAYIDATDPYTGLVRNDNIPSHHASDVVLIMDKSGSMAGTPLESAKLAALNLLAILTPVDRAALIIFSDKGRLLQQLTSSSPLLVSAIDSIVSEGSTFYIEALQLAGDQIKRSSDTRNKVVIFLSDGAPFDSGGKSAILKTVDNSLGNACLYAIGYGEQSIEAVDLLQGMASLIQEKNGCGQFYFSSADKTELSKVFGEIYALSQEPALQIYNVTLPEKVRSTFPLSVRVRSRMNGLSVPSVSTFGCIPPAEVVVNIDGKQFPLTYSGGEYKGELTLSSGEHRGTIFARLHAADNPTRIIIGSEPLTVHVRGSYWWILLPGSILIVLSIYVFMRKRIP